MYIHKAFDFAKIIHDFFFFVRDVVFVFCLFDFHRYSMIGQPTIIFLWKHSHYKQVRSTHSLAIPYWMVFQAKTQVHLVCSLFLMRTFLNNMSFNPFRNKLK